MERMKCLGNIQIHSHYRDIDLRENSRELLRRENPIKVFNCPSLAVNKTTKNIVSNLIIRKDEWLNRCPCDKIHILIGYSHTNLQLDNKP